MLPGIYDAFQHWGKQAVWIYSDPHFSDEDLECGIKNRPSDEEQIANINSCAGRKDTLIILGDVGNIECVRKLRAGRKILIMGNHDVGATKYKRDKRNVVVSCEYTKEEALEHLRQEYPGYQITFECMGMMGWVYHIDNKLFDEVYEGALIIGEKLILSHEPIPGITWAMNFHGHVHSKNAKSDKYHKNFCSDVIGYKPVNMNQLMKGGPTSHVVSIHRQTIDKAVVNKKARSGKKIGGK